MCGIAGIYARSGRSDHCNSEVARAFTEALAHRGPDGAGTWCRDGRVALAHTRLAIIDLSSGGAQPMASACGRYQLVFNGEIYNYVELRQELEAEGVAFQSGSDSEVLLELFARFGSDALARLDGMFAFAVYDAAEHSLFLARDRLGEKPLYVLRKRDTVAFASEVRAFELTGLSDGEPDLEALGIFLRKGSLPPPYTHLKDVQSVPPGHYMTWQPLKHEGVGSVPGFEPRRYWAVPTTPDSAALRQRGEVVEQVREALGRSLARRARADVPVGVFLSAGLDSTALCALFAEHGMRLRAFTVTLPGKPEDEGELASLVAAHLGVPHTKIPLDVTAGAEWFDEALAAMDVPSIDGANTWVVSQAVAREGLKVACSGLGGDELFWGYPSFDTVPRAAALSAWLRPTARFRERTRWLAEVLPARPRWSRLVDAAVAGPTVAALWLAQRGLFSVREVKDLLAEAHWADASRVDPLRQLEEIACAPRASVGRRVARLELGSYMHDQLLRDTDVMSMAHALEVRVPFIAPALVEVLAGVSERVLRGAEPKSLLREIARPLLPSAVFERAKTGFVFNWREILEQRSRGTRATCSLFRPAAFAGEVQKMTSGRAGYARVIALEVASRKFAGRGPAQPANRVSSSQERASVPDTTHHISTSIP